MRCSGTFLDPTPAGHRVFFQGTAWTPGGRRPELLGAGADEGAGGAPAGCAPRAPARPARRGSRSCRAQGPPCRAGRGAWAGGRWSEATSPATASARAWGCATSPCHLPSPAPAGAASAPEPARGRGSGEHPGGLEATSLPSGAPGGPGDTTFKGILWLRWPSTTLRRWLLRPFSMVTAGSPGAPGPPPLKSLRAARRPAEGPWAVGGAGPTLHLEGTGRPPRGRVARAKLNQDAAHVLNCETFHWATERNDKVTAVQLWKRHVLLFKRGV